MNKNINNLKRKNPKEKESIVATLCIILSIALIMGVLIADAFIKQNSINEHIAQTEETQQTMEIESKDNNEQMISEEEKSTKTQKKSTSKITSQTINLNEFTSPVSNKEITMAFSYNTTPVYSKTLMEYRSDHTGIDLKANINENVYSAYTGKIEKIYEDEKLGYTIIINHGNNIKTQYSNLNKPTNIKINDTIKQGDKIGTVGESATFEINDGEHLHFSIIKDSQYINPTQYIK